MPIFLLHTWRLGFLQGTGASCWCLLRVRPPVLSEDATAAKLMGHLPRKGISIHPARCTGSFAIIRQKLL